MSRRVGVYSESHSRKLVRKYEAGQREEEAKVPRLQDAANDPLALDPDIPPTNDHLYDQAMHIDPLLLDEEGENSSDRDQIELPVVDDQDTFSDISANEEEEQEADTPAAAEEDPKLKDLQQWVMDNNIPQLHVTKLLKILKKHHGEPYPADARTLLKTPRTKIIPIQMLPGEYYHFGVEEGILCYSNEFLCGLIAIVLDIGADGFVHKEW